MGGGEEHNRTFPEKKMTAQKKLDVMLEMHIIALKGQNEYFSASWLMYWLKTKMDLLIKCERKSNL